MKLVCIFLLLSLNIFSQDLEGVTTPSADVSASFTIPALIQELKVKEGQLVKKGEILAIQQMQVEEQQLIRLKKEATAMALVDKANVEIDYYTKDVESLREALLKGASSKKELNDSVLKLRTAELSLKEALFNKEIAKLKVKELESKITQYVLRSPVDGIVENLSIEPGESPKAGEEHIRIVSVTPMWVEVPVPRKRAISLSKTSTAKIFFPDSKNGEPAKIIFISPVADTASDTVRVKLELANKNKRLVGERVRVTFEVKK